MSTPVSKKQSGRPIKPASSSFFRAIVVVPAIIALAVVGAIIFLWQEYYTSPFERINAPIPVHIRQQADRQFIKLAGQSFFSHYVHFDSKHSSFLPSAKQCAAKPGTCTSPNDYAVYTVSYYIRDSQRPYILEPATIHVLSNGHLVSTDDARGVPRCVTRPASCVFTVTSADAARIAEENGLEPGIQKWKLRFTWDDARVQYVWYVETVLAETESAPSGKVMIIDPGTGAVLGTDSLSFITH